MTFDPDVYAAACDLHARYSISLDRRDLAPLVRCFADDAVLRVGGVDVERGGRAIAERLVDRAPTGIVHSVSTITVETDAESRITHGRAYFQLHDAMSGELTGLGSYDDVIAVVDGVACYLLREVTYLWRSSHGS